jgi:hypothetical protein
VQEQQEQVGISLQLEEPHSTHCDVVMGAPVQLHVPQQLQELAPQVMQQQQQQQQQAAAGQLQGAGATHPRPTHVGAMPRKLLRGGADQRVAPLLSNSSECEGATGNSCHPGGLWDEGLPDSTTTGTGMAGDEVLPLCAAAGCRLDDTDAPLQLPGTAAAAAITDAHGTHSAVAAISGMEGIDATTALLQGLAVHGAHRESTGVQQQAARIDICMLQQDRQEAAAADDDEVKAQQQRQRRLGGLKLAQMS